MITFKQFLREEGMPRAEMDLGDLVSQIKEKCSDIVANYKSQTGHAIWRGDPGLTASYMLKPQNGNRKSANTTNHYTVLLDSNPKNKDWPPRSKSIICSTSFHAAQGYGRGNGMGVLFPYDGTKIGVVNRPDFWSVKVSLAPSVGRPQSMPNLNKFWFKLIQLAQDAKIPIAFEGGATPTSSELAKFLDSIPTEFAAKLLSGARQYALVGDDIEDYTNEQAKTVFGAMCTWLPFAYSYNEMGCELRTSKSVELKERTEMWFSNTCFYVCQDDIPAVFGALGIPHEDLV